MNRAPLQTWCCYRVHGGKSPAGSCSYFLGERETEQDADTRSLQVNCANSPFEINKVLLNNRRLRESSGGRPAAQWLDQREKASSHGAPLKGCGASELKKNDIIRLWSTGRYLCVHPGQNKGGDRQAKETVDGTICASTKALGEISTRSCRDTKIRIWLGC